MSLFGPWWDKMWENFNESFRQMDAGFTEMRQEMKMSSSSSTPIDLKKVVEELKPGMTHETTTEEVRPDGTKVTTKTVIRRTE